jgi:hypothetical protein
MAPHAHAADTRQRARPLRRAGRRRRPWQVRPWLLAALASVLAGACREPIAPLVVDAHEVVVTNTTASAWTGLEIWVNDHYRVTASRLEPDGRLHAPLDTFVAGFGQRFDPRRQTVRGVEVTATSDTGERVRLAWGEGRRR